MEEKICKNEGVEGGIRAAMLRRRQEAETKVWRFSMGGTRNKRTRHEAIRGKAHVRCSGGEPGEDRLRSFGHVRQEVQRKI